MQPQKKSKEPKTKITILQADSGHFYVKAKSKLTENTSYHFYDNIFGDFFGTAIVDLSKNEYGWVYAPTYVFYYEQICKQFVKGQKILEKLSKQKEVIKKKQQSKGDN